MGKKENVSMVTKTIISKESDYGLMVKYCLILKFLFSCKDEFSKEKKAKTAKHSCNVFIKTAKHSCNVLINMAKSEQFLNSHDSFPAWCHICFISFYFSFAIFNTFLPFQFPLEKWIICQRKKRL